MKPKWYIEKDGWHAGMPNGTPVWVEDEPQFKTNCYHCGGSGVQRDGDGCDCVGGPCWCDPVTCTFCGGRGTLRSAPLHPKPDQAIIDKLSEALEDVMREYGKRLDDGSLERDIKEELRKRQALDSAGL